MEKVSSCQPTHKNLVVTYLKKICRVFNVNVFSVMLEDCVCYSGRVCQTI